MHTGSFGSTLVCPLLELRKYFSVPSPGTLVAPQNLMVMQGNIAADGADEDEVERWQQHQQAEQRLSAAEDAVARGAQVSLVLGCPSFHLYTGAVPLLCSQFFCVIFFYGFLYMHGLPIVSTALAASACWAQAIAGALRGCRQIVRVPTNAQRQASGRLSFNSAVFISTRFSSDPSGV